MGSSAVYNAALGLCATSSMWQHAIAILHDKDQRLEKWVVAKELQIGVNAAITACERARQWKRCLHMFEAMGNNAIQPDAVTYGAVLAGCSAAASFGVVCAWAK